MKNHLTTAKVKYEVLALINQGLTRKEVSKETKITEKTVGLWVKKWLELDKPKKAVILKLREKLNTIAQDSFSTTGEIKELVDSIIKLETELVLKGGFYWNNESKK
jgi:transcriptional regulator